MEEEFISSHASFLVSDLEFMPPRTYESLVNAFIKNCTLSRIDMSKCEKFLENLLAQLSPRHHLLADIVQILGAIAILLRHLKNILDPSFIHQFHKCFVAKMKPHYKTDFVFEFEFHPLLAISQQIFEILTPIDPEPTLSDPISLAMSFRSVAFLTSSSQSLNSFSHSLLISSTVILSTFLEKFCGDGSKFAVDWKPSLARYSLNAIGKVDGKFFQLPEVHRFFLLSSSAIRDRALIERAKEVAKSLCSQSVEPPDTLRPFDPFTFRSFRKRFIESLVSDESAYAASASRASLSCQNQ